VKNIPLDLRFLQTEVRGFTEWKLQMPNVKLTTNGGGVRTHEVAIESERIAVPRKIAGFVK
jgi:hypothetical protein